MGSLRVPFRVDEYMKSRTAALMLLLSEDIASEVDPKILHNVIRGGEDLLHRLRAQLPAKKAGAEVKRFALYGWSPYRQGGISVLMDTFDGIEKAISHALHYWHEYHEVGMRWCTIVDNETLERTDIVRYPSLKVGQEQQNGPQQGTRFSGGATEVGGTRA